MNIYHLSTASKTQELGRNLAQSYGKKPLLILLQGDLGAGKTTLAQGLLKEILGNEISIQSPTYSYMNHYHTTLPIYHFDLYRIEEEIELYNLGLTEFLTDETALRIVEWPEHASFIYYERHLLIQLERNNSGVTAKISSVN